LAKKGMPFREAHEVVGKLVRFCIENNKSLLQLSLQEFQGFSKLFEADIRDALALETVVNRRTSRGGTGRESVDFQLSHAEKLLTQTKEWCATRRRS
ncbi:MAG: argininosuccinate lyase, partial [bacterium]